MLAIFPAAISSVSSPRSRLPARMASPSNVSTAAAIEFSFRISGSIAPALFAPGKGFLRPIERALLPDIEKSGEDQNHKNEHLHEPEHLQLAVDHHPWIKEDGFDVEQDEQHSHQV